MHINFFGLIIASICLGYMIKLILTYKNQLDEQNVKILNAYLDKKLFSKLITIARVAKDDRIGQVMTIIKSYYNIGDIAIYCPSKEQFIYFPDQDEWLIERYLQENSQKITQKLDSEDIFTGKINALDNLSNIAISYAEQNQQILIILLGQRPFARQDISYILDLIKEMILLIEYFEQKKLTNCFE